MYIGLHLSLSIYIYKRADYKVEKKLNISSFYNCTAIQIILHHSANLLTLCACIKHLPEVTQESKRVINLKYKIRDICYKNIYKSVYMYL